MTNQNLSGTTLRTLRQQIYSRLEPVYGESESKWLTRMVTEHVTGKNSVDIILDAGKPVGDTRCRNAMEIVRRLLIHEPIQYITGHEQFMGFDLTVTPAVLIPRPETEELVELVIDRCGDHTDLHLLDAATGSGCIAIALARNLKFPLITATDISAEALAVARENARRLKVRIDFRISDILRPDNPLPGAPFDAIVSNPPYIMDSEKHSMDQNVLDYEPGLALFVPDSDPLRFYSALNRYAMSGGLKPGGSIFFEVNPLTVDRLAGDMRASGFINIDIMPDTSRKKRFLTAKRPSDD